MTRSPRTLGWCLVVSALIVSLAFAATPAAAHECTNTGHYPCDGHDCPRDGFHDHTSQHEDGDHSCDNSYRECDPRCLPLETPEIEHDSLLGTQVVPRPPIQDDPLGVALTRLVGSAVSAVAGVLAGAA